MNEKDIAPALTEVDKKEQKDETVELYTSNLVELVNKDFTNARDYVKKFKQATWDDCWSAYNNIRTKRGYDGVADDFIPETFTIVESIKANIAGGKPKFNFVPIKEEQNQETAVINDLVDFYWDQNNMTEKVQDWVQDMLVYGNGIMMVSWEGDMPHMTNIPLRDFFVDPTATHMNRPGSPGYPKYAGYRFLTTVEELKNRKIVDPATGDMKELYINLDDIKELNEDDPTDKTVKEKLLGSTVPDKKGQVEIIVYYTRKKKILIANRETLIYDGDNPYKRAKKTKKVESIVDGIPKTTTVDFPEIKGFLPFAILRNYVDTSLFYAKGDVEVILPRQERLNDISSQKTDNLTYVMNNMWQIDPQYKHLAEQIESFPGAVFPLPQGALTAIEKQSIGADADNEMYRIKEEMRRATAADEVIQGVSQDKGRITATEIQAQMNQASQRFSTKLTNLEDEGYSQLGRILFWMVQIFVDQEMSVKVVGAEGSRWRDFDPEEYSGEYEPKVQLESTTKAIRAEEGQKYALIHQMFAQSQYVNQFEFTKMYLESMLDMNEDRLKKLVVDPQANPAPPLPGPEMMAGQASPAMQNPGGVASGPLPTPAMA